MSGSEELPRDTGELPSAGLAYEEPLLFERGAPGRTGHALPGLDVPEIYCRIVEGLKEKGY